MKRNLNRAVSIVLLFVFTAMIVFETEKAGRHLAISDALYVQNSLSDDLPESSQKQLEERFDALLESTGLTEDAATSKKVENLFLRLCKLGNRLISGEKTLSETAFVQEAEALFREIVKIDVQMQKKDAENILRDDDSFTAIAISLFWDYLDFYEEHFHEPPYLEEGVQKTGDLFYTEEENPLQSLDVYVPEQAEEKLPIMIEIHGGGLMYGDKNKVQVYASKFAKRGYVVFAINYRLCPDVQYDDQVRDVLKAYAWIYEHAAEFGGDRENIFVVGDSAGGQLAYYTSLVMQSDTLASLYETEILPMQIRALGLVSGMFDMKNGPNSVLLTCMLGYAYKNQPYYPYLQPEEVLPFGTLPPAFLVTERKDFLRTATIDFAKLLKEKDLPYALHDNKWSFDRSMGHITSVAFPDFPESQKTTDEMVEFFEQYLVK